jgi:hypothetical protein
MSSLAAPRNATSARRVLVAGAVLGLLAALSAWMIASQLGGGAAAPEASAAAAGLFEEASGIHISRVVLTGGGGIVDVRFRVVDASKAPQLHERNSRLTLVDLDSGKTLSTSFHFHSGTTKFQQGIGYYELLVNTGGLIEPGERIAVLVGTARLDGVAVR